MNSHSDKFEWIEHPPNEYIRVILLEINLRLCAEVETLEKKSGTAKCLLC